MQKTPIKNFAKTPIKKVYQIWFVHVLIFTV